jgi:hypothetical protein
MLARITVSLIICTTFGLSLPKLLSNLPILTYAPLYTFQL